jgi:hypothetical protein
VDPVLARRERARSLANVLQRGGYALYAVAIVAFVAAAIADFPAGLVTVVVVGLVAGSVLLAPGIVIGFGVRAADRDDREHGR